MVIQLNATNSNGNFSDLIELSHYPNTFQRKMARIPLVPPVKRPSKNAFHYLISVATLIVFGLLDLLDALLCILYRLIDEVMEEDSISMCYCDGETQLVSGDGGGEEAQQVSETLYQRRNVFRALIPFKPVLKNREVTRRKKEDTSGMLKSRWSDCGCGSCLSWHNDGGQMLHVVVKEPVQASNNCTDEMTVENVIFFHGFLSSSSFWTETVFPNISEAGKQKHRLFAVDLLGFGRSPKPWDCLYTLNDHVDMVEKSVMRQFNLDSFHIVAHSMGCIIASAFAAKNVKFVKSITLIAPPYFSSSEEKASLNALNRLVQKRLWPPLLFGSAVMSWYEHVGRSVCFIICRNHRILEWAFKRLAGKRYFFVLEDLTRHTHHSAWHSMHNVICGGAKLVDRYLETLNNESRAPVTVIQGDKDQVVPMECSLNMKLKVPRAEVHIISNANHGTVVFGREQSFTWHLENIWLSTATENKSRKISC